METCAFERLQVDTSVYGLRPAPSSSPFSDLTTATVIQPGTGALVLPGVNSEIQFFDAKHDRHIMLLQAAPRNTVSVTDRWVRQGGC